MSPPDCSRKMDLNYKYYFPELFPRAFCSGRSAARTSGMGRSRCLRGTSGVGSNSSAVRCHSRTLQKEGQPTSRVSGFYQLLEKKSCTSRGCQLTSVLDYSAVRENRAGKAGACSELFMGQEGWWAQRERGPRPSVTCQIEDQRQLDVKLGTMVPPSTPSLLDLFTHEWSVKAEGSVAWGALRA